LGINNLRWRWLSVYHLWRWGWCVYYRWRWRRVVFFRGWRRRGDRSWWSYRSWRWWGFIGLLLIYVGDFLLFVAFADLDHLIDMLLFECSGNNDEVVLFFEWVAQVDNSLLLDQALGKSRLALLAPGRTGRLDFFKAGDGRAACRFGCYTLAPPDPALLTVNFDLAVVFSLTASGATVVVSNFLKVIFLVETTRG
jgi:hypothetical protein